MINHSIDQMGKHSILTFPSLLLIGIISIGGLSLLGYQAQPTAQVIAAFQACCTVETWQQAPTGYKQGDAFTFTADCKQEESQRACCFREGTIMKDKMVKVLGARSGPCYYKQPELNYPVRIGP